MSFIGFMDSKIQTSLFLFLTILIISFLLSFCINNLLLTENIFYFHYEGQFSNTKINKMLLFRDEWIWITYLLTPLILLVKIQISVLAIYLGLYLSKIKVSYNSILSIVLIAEFIFLVPVFIKLIWFSFFQSNFVLNDIRYFYPLSVFSLFEPELLEKYLYYPFKVLNLFELLYWIALASLLSIKFSRPFDDMLKVVLGYYGGYLICWVAFVMFISLSQT